MSCLEYGRRFPPERPCRGPRIRGARQGHPTRRPNGPPSTPAKYDETPRAIPSLNRRCQPVQVLPRAQWPDHGVDRAGPGTRFANEVALKPHCAPPTAPGQDRVVAVPQKPQLKREARTSCRLSTGRHRPFEQRRTPAKPDIRMARLFPKHSKANHERPEKIIVEREKSGEGIFGSRKPLSSSWDPGEAALQRAESRAAISREPARGADGNPQDIEGGSRHSFGPPLFVGRQRLRGDATWGRLPRQGPPVRRAFLFDNRVAFYWGVNAMVYPLLRETSGRPEAALPGRSRRPQGRKKKTPAGFGRTAGRNGQSSLETEGLGAEEGLGLAPWLSPLQYGSISRQTLRQG